MNPEMQTSTPSPGPHPLDPLSRGERENAGGQTPTKRTQALKGLFAEWKKYSPSLDWDCSEQEARHRFASQELKREVVSWSKLKPGEIRFLTRKLRGENGPAPQQLAMLHKLAPRVFSSDWDALLRARLVDRFETGRVESLTPRQAWSLIEELVSRAARHENKTVEQVRAEL